MWARSGSGKSTWTLNVVRNTPSIPTVIFNMEMRPEQQVEWLTSMTFDLPVSSKEMEHVIRVGPDHPEFEVVATRVTDLANEYPNLAFYQPVRPTVTELEEMVRAAADEFGQEVQRVFVDHLELLDGAEDYQGLKGVAQDLHAWAMHSHVALYVLQQTTRAGGEFGKNDGHIPITLSSGAYSGEADADFIFGLYRPDRNPEFRKTAADFKQQQAYQAMLDRKRRAENKAVLQLVKNRPYGDLCQDGIELQYTSYNRRFREVTEEGW